VVGTVNFVNLTSTWFEHLTAQIWKSFLSFHFWQSARNIFQNKNLCWCAFQKKRLKIP
jgi:hypothetical protein